MTDPTLDAMDPAAEEVALAAFTARLQADPLLSGLVRSWATWDGDPADAEPPAPDMCPWVRITATPGQGVKRLFDNPDLGATECPMLVDVELAIPDLSAAARMRFWHLVRSAALPTGHKKAPARDAIAERGVSDVELTRNGYGIDAATQDGLIVSKGQFLLTLAVDT